MADDSPAVRGGGGGGNPSTTWRKISLPLPHLFPHLTINFRGHHPRPPSPTQQASAAAKPAKRDWKLRRQKTYDSPGSLHQAISAAAAASPPAATTPVVDQNKVYRSSTSTCLCQRAEKLTTCKDRLREKKLVSLFLCACSGMTHSYQFREAMMIYIVVKQAPRAAAERDRYLTLRPVTKVWAHSVSSPLYCFPSFIYALRTPDGLAGSSSVHIHSL